MLTVMSAAGESRGRCGGGWGLLGRVFAKLFSLLGEFGLVVDVTAPPPGVTVM